MEILEIQITHCKKVLQLHKLKYRTGVNVLSSILSDIFGQPQASVSGLDIIVQVNLCAATLQDGVGLQDLLLNPGVLTTDGGQKLKDQFGALSLSRSRLTAGHQTQTHTVTPNVRVQKRAKVRGTRTT